MIQCQGCGAALTIGATDCAVCGSLVKPEPTVPGSGSGEAVDPSLGRIANLFEGNYGLPKTYWLYGVALGLVIGLVVGGVIAVSQSAVIALLGLLFIWAYQVFMTIAVWHAAAKYPGSKVWAVLARVATVVGLLRLVYETAKGLGLAS